MAPVLPPLHCSFCHISDQEAVKLLAGVNGYICTACVKTCCSLLVAADQAKPKNVVSLAQAADDAPIVLHHQFIDASKVSKSR